MKGFFHILLFVLASVATLGQGSMLSTPSEMLAMYNSYVLDFLKNGAKRTVGPNLADTALVDFGTFVSQVYPQRFPRSGIWTSTNPAYSKATLDEMVSVVKSDKYVVSELLRDADNLPHRLMLSLP
ncbi:hypothetical protein BO71DRAFT_402606 [Aspergillus ellipticus CBS 707.79]|uniref:Uncharacterized protein n=1 Tax=Aspergillus ellipticus CBS 707.79 TaxID=1448320 RepID=A0A319CXQ6_9EURO|nr:hypothetical protein BO71DRAFT_402606 [Aspergillus ellipticus CBS 707.79]